MNLSKNSDCMIPLMNYLRSHSASTLTSVNIFINATGVEITEQHKSADDLKIDGVSMRNIKGDFITEEEIKLDDNGEIIK